MIGAGVAHIAQAAAAAAAAAAACARVQQAKFAKQAKRSIPQNRRGIMKRERETGGRAAHSKAIGGGAQYLLPACNLSL